MPTGRKPLTPLVVKIVVVLVAINLIVAAMLLLKLHVAPSG